MKSRIVLCFLILFYASSAAAQDPNASNAIEAAHAVVGVSARTAVPANAVVKDNVNTVRQLGIVISGGASMGTYQAGFMHFSTEVVKRIPSVDMRMFTGASAGSANALISAINSCTPINNDPLKDIGYNVWSTVGYNTLFGDNTATSKSMFSRQTMIDSSENIWEAIRAGFPEDCDVVFGVTTTRVEAERVELVPGLSVPYPSVQFSIRIKGRGIGQPPEIENYSDHFSRLPRPVLPFKQQREWDAVRHNYEIMRDVVFASMAYPVAFAPVTIDYCPTNPYGDDKNDAGPFTCAQPTTSDVFVDGGVYDNNPLRLALHYENRGLRVLPNGGIHWKDRRIPTDQEHHAKYKATQFIYVDQDTFAYPRHPPRKRTQKTLQLIDQLQLTAENFVETSRSRELFALISEDASLRHRMRLTQANFPTVSEHVGAFMGLLEKDFRFFDFYLGMYDGLKSTRTALDRANIEMNVVKMFGLHAAPDELEENWRPFACLISYYEPGFEQYRTTCDAPRLRNFRILAQLSIDRVYAECSKLERNQVYGVTTHHHCLKAVRGDSPPRITGISKLENPDDWRQVDENSFDHTMRLLGTYGFHFKDLGLKPSESRHGRTKIRRALLEMVEHIADAQESQSHRATLLTLGRLGVNGIEYEPPEDWLYVLLGSATEVGMSILPWESIHSWYRVTWAVQMQGLFSLLTQDHTVFRIAPLLGVEAELLFMTNRFVQPMLGLRGGYQFSTSDNFHFEDCTDAETEGDGRDCSQAMISPYLAVAILERIRFQGTVNIYPKDFAFDDKSWDILFGIGVHFF